MPASSNGNGKPGRRKNPPRPNPSPAPTPAPAPTPELPSELLPFDQIQTGLSYPNFEPNGYFASDLFSDSSGLPQTDKATADVALQAIEEKRNSARILTANISLHQDLMKAGIAQQRVIGSAIDYGTAQLNNQAKIFGYQTALTNRDVAGTKWMQAQERLTQEQTVLSGLQGLTPLVGQEWEERISLKESAIEGLKLQVLQANQRLDEMLSSAGLPSASAAP